MPLWSNSRDPFFYIFIHNRSFLDTLPNFDPLRTLQRAFFGLYFREFSAAINFRCSNSSLRIGVNDVIFSKIPRTDWNYYNNYYSNSHEKEQKLWPLYSCNFAQLLLFRVVFLRIWRHFLQFSTKNWNKK